LFFVNIFKPNKSNTFFSKNRIGAFYNPLYFTRKELFKAIEILAPNLSGKLIDVGCGTKPYKDQFINVTEYVGLDIEVSGNSDSKSMVDIFYDGKTIPFKNESIDCVFSSEVFEHIFNLEEIIVEVNRVLRKDGLLLATCPFLWPEHEVPYDFARYTSFAIQNLLERNGFEVVNFQKTGNFFIAVLQLQALYLYFFINKIPFINKFFFIIFISPIFIFGSAINKILPKFMKRKDLYLNNVILAKKIS
jgi:SAM-dependent methyltransferase